MLYRLEVAAGQNTTFFLVRPPSTSPDSIKDSASAAASAPPVAEAYDSGWGYTAPQVSLIIPGADVRASASPSPSPAPIADQLGTLPALGPSRTLSSKWDELPRFPAILHAQDECRVCKQETDVSLLECEKARTPDRSRNPS